MGCETARPPLLVAALLALMLWQADAQSINGYTVPSWFSIAASGFLIGFGLFQAALGYKFFRVTLFLLGFVTAGLAVFVPAWEHISDPNAFYFAMAMGVMAGILVGGLGAWMPRIGVFLVGAALGLVLAFVLNMTVLYRLSIANPTNTLIGAAVVLGLIFGVLSIFIMRPVVIVSTSVVGAYCTVRGIGAFAGNYPDEFSLGDQLINGENLPPTVYAYFAGVTVLSVAGMVVQFRYTAKKSKDSEKDEWEQEFEDSEISLEALRGEKKKGKRKGKKSSKKGKKSKSGSSKKSKAKQEALLEEYDETGGGGYDGGTGEYDAEWDAEEGEGGYDEAAYADGGYGDDSGYGEDGNAGGGGKKGIGGWFSKPKPSAIEW